MYWVFLVGCSSCSCEVLFLFVKFGVFKHFLSSSRLNSWFLIKQFSLWVFVFSWFFQKFSLWDFCFLLFDHQQLLLSCCHSGTAHQWFGPRYRRQLLKILSFRMTSEVDVDLLSVEELNGGRNNGEGAPLKKGPWNKEEDAILKDYVAKYGAGHWSSVHKRTELARCGKSCRLRWANHLKPNIKKGAFTLEEEERIIELHAKLGNKWSQIAAEFPGRTDNDIKNFWNTRLRRQRRAEKYLDKQNTELVISSSANSDPALFAINKNIEIPTVEFKKFEPSPQLYPPGLHNTGSSSLLDQNLNSSLDTCSVCPTVHPPKGIRGSWFSDRIADISHLSFSGSIPVSHPSLYGNSSSESGWDHKLELPSRQTSLARWSAPSSIPSLESSYTLIQTPPNEYTDSFSLLPQSGGLLNTILYGSQTPPRASWNNSNQEASHFVVPDSCPVLEEILGGTSAGAISPSCHSTTSLFNEYTPNIGGSREEHQSIAPLIGFDVNQEMANFAPPLAWMTR